MEITKWYIGTLGRLGLCFFVFFLLFVSPKTLCSLLGIPIPEKFVTRGSETKLIQSVSGLCQISGLSNSGIGLCCRVWQCCKNQDPPLWATTCTESRFQEQLLTKSITCDTSKDIISGFQIRRIYWLTPEWGHLRGKYHPRQLGYSVVVLDENIFFRLSFWIFRWTNNCSTLDSQNQAVQ